MRLLRFLALGAALLPLAVQPAAAQAVPPIGHWASAAGNALVVNDDATCGYMTSQLRVQGNCSWHGSGPADGVLVIDFTNANQALQQMFVSIHWINYGRILVLGEAFQRR